MDLLHERLSNALSDLREALDLSIQLRRKGQDEKAIGLIWSQFLGEFFAAVKQKSKESQQNLLAWVKLPKL